jgi:hypothetical protein
MRVNVRNVLAFVILVLLVAPSGFAFSKCEVCDTDAYGDTARAACVPPTDFAAGGWDRCRVEAFKIDDGLALLVCFEQGNWCMYMEVTP